MLITKCTEEFHRKYEQYSSKDTVKGLEMQGEPVVEEPVEPKEQVPPVIIRVALSNADILIFLHCLF